MRRSNFNIFKYPDYRLFLKDYYESQKKRDRKFSYRSFAIQADTAPSLLKDIIEGRRRLTLPVMKKFAKVMELDQRETDYFEILVKFINAKTNEEKNIFFNNMVRARKKGTLSFLDKSQYDFYSNWYHSAIRELITLPDFKDDPQWIAKRLKPRVTPGMAKKSLQLMEKLNIIKRNVSGKWEQCDEVISAEYELQSMIMRNFNTEMIQLGKEAQERFPVENREISSLTLGVSNDCYTRIKQRVRMFKEELLNMVVNDQTESETVCQVNFQLFPLEEGNSGRDA